LLPDDAAFADYIQVIDIPAFTKGQYLDVVMNDEEEVAVGYLKRET
jgi:hypothetical protein